MRHYTNSTKIQPSTLEGATSMQNTSLNGGRISGEKLMLLVVLKAKHYGKTAKSFDCCYWQENVIIYLWNLKYLYHDTMFKSYWISVARLKPSQWKYTISMPIPWLTFCLKAIELQIRNRHVDFVILNLVVMKKWIHWYVKCV